MNYRKVRGLLVPAEHVSVSQVKLFQTCSMMHCYKYEMGVKEKRRFRPVRGNVLHKLAETDYAYKKEAGTTLSLDTKEQIYRELLGKELASEPILDVPDDIEKDTRKVIEALGLFDANVAQKVEPLEVEKLIVYENPEFALPVVIFIDLTAISPESGAKIVADSKFTSSRTVYVNPATDLQMGIYAIAEGTDHVEYHRATLDKPAAERIAGTVTSQFKDHVIDVFARTSKAIKEKAYTYRNPGLFPCTPGSCDYWDHCMGKFK